MKLKILIALLFITGIAQAQPRQSGGISFTPQWNYKISGSDTTWQFGNTLISQFPYILTKWQSDQRYAPIAGGGYVPTSRTLTIGTTTADLSANRTFLLGNLTNGVGIQSLTYDGTTSPTVKVDTANITSKTFFNTRIGTATAASIATKGTVTSITPGYGFTSSTPITTSGTITIDTTKITDLAHFNGKIGTGVATALAGKQATGNYITALTGEATAGGPGSVAITLSNSAVIGKVLTGFVSGAGTVAATDNILQAIQKLNGNIGALVTGVSSFNTRTGAITLTSSDVTTALTFTPENVANKATTYGTINNTLYPSIKLVSDSTLHPNKNLSDVVNKPTALVNLGAAPVGATMYIGTTAHTLNRASASEALTGVTFPTAPTATDMPVRWQDTTRFLTKYALPNMLMIGNSLTYGTGSTSTDSTMTANLGRLTGRFVYNYGVPGETSTQIRTRFFALSGAMKQLPIIIEAGRNNYTDSATVIADISAMANYLISIHNNKFLIDAIPNASGEPFGNSGYDIIIATNVRLAKLFPGHFVDSRQALLGYGNGSGTDNTDIANSVIPTSLRSDNIHLNDKGYRTKAGIYMAYLSVLQGESSYTAGLSVSGSPGSGFQGVGVATFTLANGHGYIQNYNNFYPAVNLPLPLHIQSPASSSLGLIENGGTLNIGDPGIDASTTTQTFTWNASTNQVKRIARGQIASSGSTITVGSGSGTVIGANVNLDISATYPGQTSITTLGTVGTGTWNGTIIGSTKGGSGVNNAGTLTWGAGGTLGTNAYTSTAFNSGAGTENYFTGYTGTNTQSTSNGFQFDGSGNMFSTANGTAGGFWLASNNSTYTQGIQFASGNINLYSTNNRVNTNAVTTGLSFYSTSTVPTISLGAGATGTISIVGNNQDGTITFTGTYTSGDLAVITMSGSFAYPTKCTPVISGVGGTAGLTFGPTAAGSTSTGWRIGGGGAIPVSTTVAWNYHNGGY